MLAIRKTDVLCTDFAIAFDQQLIRDFIETCRSEWNLNAYLDVENVARTN